MFEYKATEKFDIGAGHGVYEYDFFTINSEDDLWALVKHYGAVCKRFNYYLDGLEIVENNTRLSPVVQAKMEEHDANLCLTFLEKEFKKNTEDIKKIVVNEQKPNGIYNTYYFYFYYSASARDYYKRGLVHANSGLHNAAIKYFSLAIKLDPSLGLAFLYRGISYSYTGNYFDAIEDFTQAININVKKPEVFTLRGFAYLEAGDINRAVADFTRALELNPDDETAKKSLEEINKA